ncbi:MAG: hypothetical protein V7L14_14250 [Nostoc sp.]|uniref:hypothetical protein n=1 Tax=Nostoc sp. TaxID=1180 RepID=UPI002FF9271E
MDINLALAIIGIVVSVVSFIYAIYVTNQSKKEKELMFDVIDPMPLVDTIPKDNRHSIKIIYERPNQPSESVDSIFLQFLPFTNFGRVPIRKEDSASYDPLRIEVQGGRVLDVALASVTREVSRITLNEIKQVDDKTIAVIDFDFLDYMDGGLIQVVSDSADVEVTLKGTIVGMPTGIKKVEPEKNSIIFPELGCVIPLIIQVGVLVAVPFIYRYITGNWRNVWLLLLPILALILPIALIMPVILALLNRKTIQFPKRLSPPSWYNKRRDFYERSPHRRSR